MADTILRDAVETDFARIVELNAAEVVQTSPMDLDRLRLLHGLAAYRNDNFFWFAARYPRFLYVDRIVVDSAFSGLGIGRRMYEDLFGYARSRGIGMVTCEYNIEPPNPASRAFHDKFGFREVGSQYVANGTKRVSLQVAEAGPAGVDSSATL